MRTVIRRTQKFEGAQIRGNSLNSSKLLQRENTVSAHKYMLITRSPVFCAMLTGPAKDESHQVEIEDVDKGSFLEMLRYVSI